MGQTHEPPEAQVQMSGQHWSPQTGRPSAQVHCPAWQVTSEMAGQAVPQAPQKRRSVRRFRQRPRQQVNALQQRPRRPPQVRPARRQVAATSERRRAARSPPPAISRMAPRRDEAPPAMLRASPSKRAAFTRDSLRSVRASRGAVATNAMRTWLARGRAERALRRHGSVAANACAPGHGWGQGWTQIA